MNCLKRFIKHNTSSASIRRFDSNLRSHSADVRTECKVESFDVSIISGSRVIRVCFREERKAQKYFIRVDKIECAENNYIFHRGSLDLYDED